jgi:hypothetical protein
MAGLIVGTRQLKRIPYNLTSRKTKDTANRGVMTSWNTRTKKYIAALKDANIIPKMHSGPTYPDHFISSTAPCCRIYQLSVICTKVPIILHE